MSTKEAIEIIEEAGYNVKGPESFYSGSGYKNKYAIKESASVRSKSPYLGLPVIVKSAGFIAKNKKVGNYYFHNGSGFDTFTDIEEFIERLKSNIK